MSRAVRCWACGEELTAPDAVTLEQALADHVEAEHGARRPETAEVRAWIERKGTASDAPEVVLWLGRVAAATAAATFILLALMNPNDLAGSDRTIEFLTYGAFAAIALTGLCILVAVGRLLRR